MSRHGDFAQALTASCNYPVHKLNQSNSKLGDKPQSLITLIMSMTQLNNIRQRSEDCLFNSCSERVTNDCCRICPSCSQPAARCQWLHQPLIPPKTSDLPLGSPNMPSADAPHYIPCPYEVSHIAHA